MRIADPWPPPERPRFRGPREHWRVGRESLAFVSRRPGTTLLVWLLIGIALALPAALYLMQRHLGEIADEWRGRPGLSVYFEVGADIAAAHALQRQLEALPAIDRAWVITPEQALDEFRGNVAVADALELLDENPLPASLRATLATDAPSSRLNAAARLAGRAAAVEEVVLETAWLERLAALSAVANRLGAMLAILFGIGAALIAASSVRLAIEARLEELRVQRLVGGTTAFIRRPFLYLGFIYGLGGGMVAAMLIAAALIVLEPPLGALFDSYGNSLQLDWMDRTFVSALLGSGGLLGVAGALIASRQRLAALEVA